MLAEFLPRHSLTAKLLRQTLYGIEEGRTVKSVWETFETKLAMETFYHVLQRLRHDLDRLRSKLCSLTSPLPTEHNDPLLQTIAHLRNVFHDRRCAVAAFQCDLQLSFTG
jgi:hypothetical protein